MENGCPVRAVGYSCIISRLESERASYNGSIEASQASDVGSIPIARSITHGDSIGLTHLDYLNPRQLNHRELWSGRWESNPRPKLGKLLYCHCTTHALMIKLPNRRGACNGLGKL